MISDAKLYVPTLAEIVRTRQLTELEKFFEIRLLEPRPFPFEPGQFILLSVLGVGEAPVTLASSPLKKDGVEVCVRRVGSLTNALHRLQEGATIGLRGPFGKGFPIEALKGKDLLFVAGGIGIIPLRSLIHYVLERRKDFGQLSILYGAKTPKEFLFADELKAWGQRGDVRLLLTVDKPDETWKGNAGVITRLIPPLELRPKETYAVIVGPPVMYKFVLMELYQKALPESQILMSLERRMRCGVGKCGHCQINNVYVCQEGPVFSYQFLKRLPEAI
ncbi:MAG TPA: FAD/NAD(P)-binding protein [Candidatus Brocadiales bacterium]|nr:FAD/NAD(P)-binding protein [Candidatus Brocadiales bacterium]